MHVKLSFAHRLQTAKMASSRSSAQNNSLKAQNNGVWVQSVVLERKMFYTVSVVLTMLRHACKTLVCAPFTDSENGPFPRQCAK